VTNEEAAMTQRRLRVMRGEDVLFETPLGEDDVVELIETATEEQPDVATELAVWIRRDSDTDESVIVPEPLQEEETDATTQEIRDAFE